MDKFGITEQCPAAAQKISRMLGCISVINTIRDNEAIIPIYSALVRPCLCSVLVPATQNRCGQAGEGSSHKADQYGDSLFTGNHIKQMVVMGTKYSGGDSDYTQKEKFSHEDNQPLGQSHQRSGEFPNVGHL